MVVVNGLDIHGHPDPLLLLGEVVRFCGHHHVVHVAVHLPHLRALETGVHPL